MYYLKAVTKEGNINIEGSMDWYHIKKVLFNNRPSTKVVLDGKIAM